jgi:hypothetical protein
MGEIANIIKHPMRNMKAEINGEIKDFKVGHLSEEKVYVIVIDGQMFFMTDEEMDEIDGEQER